MLPDQLEKAEQIAPKPPKKQEVRKKSYNTFPFKSKQTSKPRFLLLTTHMLPDSGSRDMMWDEWKVVKNRKRSVRGIYLQTDKSPAFSAQEQKVNKPSSQKVTLKPPFSQKVTQMI